MIKIEDIKSAIDNFFKLFTEDQNTFSMIQQFTVSSDKDDVNEKQDAFVQNVTDLIKNLAPLINFIDDMDENILCQNKNAKSIKDVLIAEETEQIITGFLSILKLTDECCKTILQNKRFCFAICLILAGENGQAAKEAIEKQLKLLKDEFFFMNIESFQADLRSRDFIVGDAVQVRNDSCDWQFGVVTKIEPIIRVRLNYWPDKYEGEEWQYVIPVSSTNPQEQKLCPHSNCGRPLKKCNNWAEFGEYSHGHSYYCHICNHNKYYDSKSNSSEFFPVICCSNCYCYDWFECPTCNQKTERANANLTKRIQYSFYDMYSLLEEIKENKNINHKDFLNYSKKLQLWFSNVAIILMKIFYQKPESSFFMKLISLVDMIGDDCFGIVEKILDSSDEYEESDQETGRIFESSKTLFEQCVEDKEKAVEVLKTIDTAEIQSLITNIAPKLHQISLECLSFVVKLLKILTEIDVKEWKKLNNGSFFHEVERHLENQMENQQYISEFMKLTEKLADEAEQGTDIYKFFQQAKVATEFFHEYTERILETFGEIIVNIVKEKFTLMTKAYKQELKTEINEFGELFSEHLPQTKDETS